MKGSKCLLLILDGWGLGRVPEADAIAQANTPFFDELRNHQPFATLVTYGEDVGLPEGQMGNSEVGHMNIGAGRVVYQELVRINRAVRNGDLARNPVIQEAIRYAREQGKPIHLLGLISDGGVHSHIDHLLALVDILEEAKAGKTYIHGFLDGRDTDPQGGVGYIETVLRHIQGKQATLASLTGRYYAMDRDKRWERVQVAYDALVKGIGKISQDPLAALRESYVNGITDEFVRPILMSPDGMQAEGSIRENDVVIFFNFRTDRPRELTTVLSQTDMPEHGMHRLPLHYVTMTDYDTTYENVHVVFQTDNLKMTLGEYLSEKGKTQLRIAETEKYPHVTFFFSGGREEPFPGEQRILVPSPKVATYDLQPEMSALEVCQRAMDFLVQEKPDFICLNFANTDMVGHTGVFQAAMKAAETVDQCLSRLVPLARENGYSCLILADHGNSDYMINPDGSPNTAHTMNPVPLILVSDQTNVHLQDGRLADVAPTILHLMGMDIPYAMTGKILIEAS